MSLLYEWSWTKGHTYLSFGVLIGWCSHTAAERGCACAARLPPTVTSRCCPAYGVGLSEKYISVLAFNSTSLFWRMSVEGFRTFSFHLGGLDWRRPSSRGGRGELNEAPPEPRSHRVAETVVWTTQRGPAAPQLPPEKRLPWAGHFPSRASPGRQGDDAFTQGGSRGRFLAVWALHSARLLQALLYSSACG